ncbi:MAG: oxygenase MpaB family protein [Verrucomicrobiota bacterium]
MTGEFVPFGPDSMMWRINRERVVLLAGPAAAVLQVAHPQVAMGVAAHSKFRTDSIGRLHRTLEAVYSVAFGTSEEVERVHDGVAHRPVRGEGYSAFDQDAQLWVLATLIMGSVNMYQRFVGKLTVPELDRFLEENSRFGEVFGLDPAMLPKSWSGFERYYEETLNGPLLGSHPLCAEVANAVIKLQAPWLMRALSPVFRALAIEYLPPALRDCLQIDSGLLAGVLWPTLARFLSVILGMCPASLRYAPQYLIARKRLRSLAC